MLSEFGETLDCKDKAQCLEMLVKIKLKYVTLANDNQGLFNSQQMHLFYLFLDNFGKIKTEVR